MQFFFLFVNFSNRQSHTQFCGIYIFYFVILHWSEHCYWFWLNREVKDAACLPVFHLSVKISQRTSCNWLDAFCWPSCSLHCSVSNCPFFKWSKTFSVQFWWLWSQSDTKPNCQHWLWCCCSQCSTYITTHGGQFHHTNRFEIS